MNTLRVTMLGPSGVGKTSLLTAMYGQFNDTIGTTDLSLTPDRDSTTILQNRLADLKRLLEPSEIMGRYGLQGDIDLKTYTFDIGRKFKRPTLRINFVDYPGGYIGPLAAPEHRDKVYDLIKYCAAVVIAIDAPSLMECNGKYNDLVNRPQQITNMFGESYQELGEPRLVLFAPVKCEKYVKTQAQAKILKSKVKDTYKGLINLFLSEGANNNVAAVITPVQTVGSVILSSISEVDSTPIYYFRKIRNDASYNPTDSEQPLRYLLRFLLRIHYEQKSTSWGVFNFLRSWFDVDEHLRQAVKTFSLSCKDANNSNEFEVLMGHKWLDVR